MAAPRLAFSSCRGFFPIQETARCPSAICATDNPPPRHSSREPASSRRRWFVPFCDDRNCKSLVIVSYYVAAPCRWQGIFAKRIAAQERPTELFLKARKKLSHYASPSYILMELYKVKAQAAL